MAKCPICGKEVTEPEKTWKLANGKVLVKQYVHCGKKFREYIRVEG